LQINNLHKRRRYTNHRKDEVTREVTRDTQKMKVCKTKRHKRQEVAQNKKLHKTQKRQGCKKKQQEINAQNI